MSEIARHWRILAGGTAVGAASVVCFAGLTAAAQPATPQPPLPGPVTHAVPAAPNAAVPQTAAVAPTAAPQQGVTAAQQPAVSAPPPVTITPATSETIAEYFAEAGVTLEPQSNRDFRALKIVLPMPPGWAHIPDPNVPDAFVVIADRVGGNGLHSSNAQVVIYKLIGEFDPNEAISHGFVESQQLPAWRSTKASLASYGGMPSSLIEGTYRENAMTLNTSRRQVIAASGPDKYLVSLAVTTSIDQVVPAAGATEAIVNGFRVSAPAAAPAAPTPTATPASVPAAATTPASVPTAAAPLASVPAAAAAPLASVPTAATPPASIPTAATPPASIPAAATPPAALV
ncbi:MAG: LpqN/LpqT family lipoprotein, partial [Mycobacterium sp.]